PGLKPLPISERLAVFRLDGFVAQRNGKIKSNAIAGEVVSKQLSKGVCKASPNDRLNVGTKLGADSLNAADTALRVACADGQVWQQLILRVLQVDVAVLELQIDLT